MGEHSDWAGGFRRFNKSIAKGCCLVVGTNEAIFAEARAHHSRFIIKSHNKEGLDIPMTAEALLAVANKGGYYSYAAGVAFSIMTMYNVGGLVINNYKTTLPVAKGLSSSAAVCVLVARSFNRVYDLKMTTRGEMEFAYQGEILTPSQCGRMDQACAFGGQPVVMYFDGDFLEVKPIQIQKRLHLVVVDLNAAKDTTEILQKLQDSYPKANTALDEEVQHLLGELNLDITKRAISAMITGDTETLGKIYTEAQAAFDKAAGAKCPSQLTAPVLHKVINDPLFEPYIYGAKGVGSQGDGTAQFLCRDAESQQHVKRILKENYPSMDAFDLVIEPSTKVLTALIPAAGLNTRLFPASMSACPSLFPVVDISQTCKPAILTIVEELYRAGIQKIVIIVRQEDLHSFESLFYKPPSQEYFHRLSPKDQLYSKQILRMGERVQLKVQENAQGFGHAVYCAHEFVGDEPFILVLGDHLYRSSTDKSCTEQIIEIYDRYNDPVISLHRTPQNDVSRFGVITGTWISEEDNTAEVNQQLLHVTEIAEKPSLERAQATLRVEGLEEVSDRSSYYHGMAVSVALTRFDCSSFSLCPVYQEFCTVFGMYVLDASLFGYLKHDITHNIRVNGDFQLTPALNRMCKEKRVKGLMMAGRRFDMGNPESVVEALVAFRSPDLK